MTQEKIKVKLQNAWGQINDFLARRFSMFIKKKIINYLIEYILYLLLVLSVLYAAYHLIHEIIIHFMEPIADKNIPFILIFSEHLFLNFLPIFVLFGFLKYYQHDLKRFLTDSKNEPDKKAEEQLHLSKKLFFSSVLSYIVIKIIEKLFFNYYQVQDFTQLLSVGVFFLILIIFVLIQHFQKHD